MTEADTKGDWLPEQAVLPHAVFTDDAVTIYNLRSRTYRKGEKPVVSYREKTVLLADIRSVDVGLAALPGYVGVAHTFTSFALRDGSHIAVSIEARRHTGERYSPIRGLFNTYPLMYVVADESDVVGVRAVVSNDDVYLYPTRLSDAEAQAMFVSMLMRANALTKSAEFYNTVTNSCTTNLVRHIDIAIPGSVKPSVRIPLSLGIDTLLYESGLVDSSVTPAEARTKYKVSERARALKDGEDFSAGIRRLS
ncbi:DUF4105 domain-containing protein [Candidatus Kaiserbacteria bacterium]|nr:DUF4105 domain-containing protein [Candidatus Kaiserbacteria bacterium]